MQFIQQQQEFIILLKMVFSKGFNTYLATLFGIGKLPGGGTIASLLVLLIALYEQNAVTASFLAFFTLIIAPKAYKKLSKNSEIEDPKEFVLDEVIGMGIAISGVYILSNSFKNFSLNIAKGLSDVDTLFILTFLIFRFFDISKLGPVGWVENNQNEEAYIKVIGDDIVAAILSIILVIIILTINLWVQS